MSANPEDATMTFWEHLAELRSRLIRMALAFTVGAAVAWFYRQALLGWLTEPFTSAWQSGKVEGSASLHFAAPAALFVAYVKLALLGGLVLALPVILYQLWMFVSPGLYAREKRIAIPFVVVSCLLFASGGYFGYRVAFPIAFRYLLSFSGPVGAEGFEVTPTVMIGEYLDFVSRMLLAFGTTFELPVVVFFLSISGVITHRHLIKFARYFVVVAFILAAIITPPDITSQFLLAVPLCILYGVSIGIAYVFGRKPKPE
jgi:sec-independent protein translocase protein TatC